MNYLAILGIFKLGDGIKWSRKNIMPFDTDLKIFYCNQTSIQMSFNSDLPQNNKRKSHKKKKRERERKDTHQMLLT